MQKAAKKWYTNWFDTEFYHILYQDRDYKEAQLFMDNLTRYLNIPLDGSILDLACGKGRHSIYLNSLGYDVTGIDISKNSIQHAKKFENEKLHFEVHDMSKPYSSSFDAVFNLFTSFGYFDLEEDNLNTIKAIKSNLKTYGVGVIDFLNIDFVKNNLVKEDIKIVDGIKFHQKRFVEDGYLFKEINFTHNKEDYFFTERVKAISLQDFENYFKEANIDLIDIFGDYKLNTFQKNTSERLIMIFT